MISARGPARSAAAIVACIVAVALAGAAAASPGALACAAATLARSPDIAAYSVDASSGTLVLQDIRRIYGGRPGIDPGEAGLLALAGGAVLLVDRDLYDQLNSGPANPELERWSETITNLGLGTTGLGISGLIALRDPETGYLAANAVVYSGISCVVLKALFGRARPEVGEGPYAFSGPGIRQGYDSMPSGHSATAFALATVLAKQYPKYRGLFYAGAALVAVSRVYEHAHWPSDTIVGAAIGIWSANQVMSRSRIFELTF